MKERLHTEPCKSLLFYWKLSEHSTRFRKGRQGVLNTNNNEHKRSVKKKEKGEGRTRGEGKGNEGL